jgi:hypothetical protein
MSDDDDAEEIHRETIPRSYMNLPMLPDVEEIPIKGFNTNRLYLDIRPASLKKQTEVQPQNLSQGKIYIIDYTVDYVENKNGTIEISVLTFKGYFQDHEINFHDLNEHRVPVPKRMDPTTYVPVIDDVRIHFSKFLLTNVPNQGYRDLKWRPGQTFTFPAHCTRYYTSMEQEIHDYKRMDQLLRYPRFDPNIPREIAQYIGKRSPSRTRRGEIDEFTRRREKAAEKALGYQELPEGAYSRVGSVEDVFRSAARDTLSAATSAIRQGLSAATSVVGQGLKATNDLVLGAVKSKTKKPAALKANSSEGRNSRKYEPIDLDGFKKKYSKKAKVLSRRKKSLEEQLNVMKENQRLRESLENEELMRQEEEMMKADDSRRGGKKQTKRKRKSKRRMTKK